MQIQEEQLSQKPAAALEYNKPPIEAFTGCWWVQR